MRPLSIDLRLLKQEVLSRGPEAALPCNLSDYWLHQVSESLDKALKVSDEEAVTYLSAPLALIMHLLRGKTGAKEAEIKEEELYDRLKDYLNDYRLELGFEEMSRCSDIKATPATLATIFTERQIALSENEV